MDHPWGLSGPEFLVLYGVALLGLLLLVVVVTLLTKVGGGAADGGGGREPNGDEELGHYESAYLFGGVDRVADTAVAGLVAADSLRVSRSHALSPTRITGDDEYQNRVLEESWSDLNRVRRALRVSHLCEPLGRSLQRRGLVVNESRRRAAAALAWLFPLLGLVGIVRLLNGVAHGYPVGLLVLELFGTVIVWAVARVAGKEPRPTWAGERVKRRRRKRDASRRSPDRDAGSAEPMTAMVLVSVGGMSAYPDPGLAPFLAPWVSSGGSGGGGSGGGGSGGGGGGGCGGGGG